MLRALGPTKKSFFSLPKVGTCQLIQFRPFEAASSSANTTRENAAYLRDVELTSSFKFRWVSPEHISGESAFVSVFWMVHCQLMNSYK